MMMLVFDQELSLSRWFLVLVHLATDHIFLIGAIVIALIVAYQLSVYSKGSNITADDSSNEGDGDRVQTINECDEEDENTLEQSSSNTMIRLSRGDRSNRKKRTVDWVHDARKIYRRLMKPNYPTLSDDVTKVPNLRRSTPSRRHSSVGPLQLARAAKDFIVLGSSGARFQRQLSEMNRTSLPKPPSEFFEPSETTEVPETERPEVYHILHILKMLELPLEWNLDSKNISVEHYDKDDYLVRSGDKDDNIIVVLSGVIAVFIMYGDNKELMVHKITVGDSFFSLLSLLDMLMNIEVIFRNVFVKALTPCCIARYKTHYFRESYNQYPQLWLRPVQIVLTKLLHVTLTTLHQYLGLTTELFKKRLDEKRTLDDRHRHMMGTFNSVRTQNKIKQRVRRLSSSDDVNEQLVTACRWFADVLQLGSSPDVLASLMDRVKVVNVAENQLITEQNGEEENLIMVMSGLLKISQESVDGEDENSEDEHIFIHPRELIGALQLLTSEPSFFTLRSHSIATYAVISKKNFFELVDLYPKIIMPVAYSVIRRLSPFVRNVDFAIDWVLLDSGQAVYRSGDIADSIFVVLSGRLRSVENKQIIEEFGRGDILGMIELLKRVPRSTTVIVIRYSQLARLPEGLLNFVKMKFPQVGFRLVHLLGQYYSSSIQQMPNFSLPFRDGLSSTTGDPQSHIKNLHTIAVVAATADVPLVAFTSELYYALNANLRVLRLSSKTISEHLGSSVLEKISLLDDYDRQADFRLMHWLNLQEDTYPLIIYQCDNSATNWTRRCLRQADAILFVAYGDRKPPKRSLIDEYLITNQDGIRTNKELILLWDSAVEQPCGTIEWLKGSWYSGHHHIRMPKRMIQWDSKNVSEVEIISYYEKNVFGQKIDHNSDLARLARMLTGNAIGVVLGGGGARGAAHVGVLNALKEHGIPIDMIGGTSIGSMIGGLYAQGDDDLQQRARDWFLAMGSVWPKIWDLTYAHSAMFTGAGFNSSLQDLFSESLIEDLWIPYFCITTDISNSEMRVHRSGPVWAYCRASMSLAGYLPPLCDPTDGHLLLDGGYVNNLPADVMKSMGAKIVIAVDVGSAAETNLYNYGDSLSGFWVLLRKLNPFMQPVKVLNMEEIQSRLAYVSCVQQLQLVKQAPYCQYIRPPIEEFKTLDFLKFDSVYEVGYKHGNEVFRELVKSSDDLRALTDAEKLRILKRRYWRCEPNKLGVYDTVRSSSFTNLAARVSKVPRICEKNSSTNDEVPLDDVDELLWDIDDDDQSDISQPPYASDDVASLEAGYNSEPCTAYQTNYASSDKDEDHLSVDKHNHKYSLNNMQLSANCDQQQESKTLSPMVTPRRPADADSKVRFRIASSPSNAAECVDSDDSSISNVKDPDRAEQKF